MAQKEVRVKESEEGIEWSLKGELRLYYKQTQAVQELGCLTG